MKKLFGLLAVLVVVAASFSSCGPSAEELEEQRIADSIRVADSLGAIALADSLALVAYEDSLRTDSIEKAEAAAHAHSHSGGNSGGGDDGDNGDDRPGATGDGDRPGAVTKDEDKKKDGGRPGAVKK